MGVVSNCVESEAIVSTEKEYRSQEGLGRV